MPHDVILRYTLLPGRVHRNSLLYLLYIQRLHCCNITGRQLTTCTYVSSSVLHREQGGKEVCVMKNTNVEMYIIQHSKVYFSSYTADDVPTSLYILHDGTSSI